ncbi:MAG: hypothetical protein ACLGIY_20485 [Betaproteobacteria bacterium]|jgi:hypothetical protein
MQALNTTHGPAVALQQLQLAALENLTPGDRARVEDLCPAICTREELEKFIQNPPSAWWQGYGMACAVMRTELAAAGLAAF